MKIYTKTGDEGKTGLFGGGRILKSELRIESYGTVDELNAVIGLLRDHLSEETLRSVLFTIQNRLFTIGAHLATEPGKEGAAPDLLVEDVQLLEEEMDRMDESLEPLRNFILPGGHPSISYCHLARTVCRRAERRAVALAQLEEVPAILIQYLNRLSDYFFILGRYQAKAIGVEEVAWKGRG